MGYWLLWLLPKHTLSRALGWLSDQALPQWILQLWIRIFIRAFQIDMKDYDTPLSEYQTFNQFFTRPLKPGVRPIDPAPNAVVSPVDGTIGQLGTIHNGALIQAKGIDYPLAALLDDPQKAKDYEGGFFITIYLAPYNYHRIHSMTAGHIHEARYLPGELWTVSPLGVRSVPGLFARNERLVSYVTCDNEQTWALVKVGATVVGRIRVHYHSEPTHQLGAQKEDIEIATPYVVEKGAELGQFEFGSTVVCVFPKDMVEWNTLQVGQTVELGEILGTLKK